MKEGVKMFYLSILAGFLICLGGIINLSVGGGILGATLFSIGLLTILYFKLNLFTGKAGLLFDNKITDIDLIKIWIGNFIGCAFCACLMAMSGWD